MTSLNNLWDEIDEDHIISQDYRSSDDLSGAVFRAKMDAVYKTDAERSVVQRKLLADLPITYDENLQLMLDFPA